jgi:hypothetical protein
VSQFRQVTAIATFFILIGLASLIAGAIFFLRTSEFLAIAKTAPGRVIRLDPDTDNHHNITYHTVFTFDDDSRSSHTIRTSYSQRPQPYDVGDRIVVLYPLDSPDDARIRSFSSLWLLPTILGAIGVVFPAVGLFAFISAHKTYGLS